MSRKNKYFISNRDANLCAFEENFLSKFTTYLPQIQISSTEADRIINSISAHRHSYSTMISKRAESKAATEANNAAKEKAINDIRRCAHYVKSMGNYTTAIGQDLGIIGPETALVDMTLLKPVLKPKVIGNQVRIKFARQETEGIRLYSRRSHETEFRLVHLLKSHSPYVDIRINFDVSKPEYREYYAMFVMDMKEIGQRSDIVKVLVPAV